MKFQKYWNCKMFPCLEITTITQLISVFVLCFWSLQCRCLVKLFMKWVQFINNYQKSTLGEPMKKFVHLSPQEEECTTSSWRDNKMYTTVRIASLQRILTEINDSGAITKIRIWVESHTVKHLRAFRIISSKMLISLLILSW